VTFSLAIAVAASPALATTPTHRSSAASSAHSTHKTTLKSHKRTRGARGQQAIDPERATQIQQALIREHYLTGEATGKWDSTTIAAMQKFQADQGWQTKIMPDSRALVKLGLGPDYSAAINNKDGSFNAPAPAPASAIPAQQAAGFAAAAGVNR
jgi:peptidoglycan hydrolase-like protein with peptidoglycan-binding domain